MVSGLRAVGQAPAFCDGKLCVLPEVPEELAVEIFEHILNKALNNHMVDSSMVFIDRTHIKASANKKKYQKEQVAKAARVYAKRLREEVNEERAKLEKPPVEEEDDDSHGGGGQQNRWYRRPTRSVGCTTKESMKSSLPMKRTRYATGME